MWFWFIFLILCLILPATFIIVGYVLLKHTPKTIDDTMGYRTKMSKLSPDTWNFAQKYMGKMLLVIGIIITIPSIIPFVFLFNKSESVISIAFVIVLMIQVLILLASIVQTEKTLKANFTDEGLKK